MVTVQIDDAAVQALVRDGLISTAAREAAESIKRRAQSNIDTAPAPTHTGRNRTGAMRRSMRIKRMSGNIHEATYRLSVNVPYAGFQEFGRGPVRPKRARVLHWVSRSGGDVFSMYAGPDPGGHFMRDAVNATTVDDFTRVI